MSNNNNTDWEKMSAHKTFVLTLLTHCICTPGFSSVHIFTPLLFYGHDGCVRSLGTHLVTILSSRLLRCELPLWFPFILTFVTKENEILMSTSNNVLKLFESNNKPRHMDMDVCWVLVLLLIHNWIYWDANYFYDLLLFQLF